MDKNKGDSDEQFISEFRAVVYTAASAARRIGARRKRSGKKTVFPKMPFSNGENGIAEKRFEKKCRKTESGRHKKTGKGSNHHVKNIYISRSAYRKDTSA